ncbi:Alg9-like mannosyltransferase family-domain-containing protein [Scheffersomyces amazonensis]|uniref:Alg9-like mannosyltransferase family-domain-containing protein n=1 Tax=Scheffersomyces amazonensis TaxID=1078765 RepID=UPI00315DA8DB
MYKFNGVLDAALIGLISFYLVLSPFTKVEESFNLQAIHDIINYGIFPQQVIEDNYDHINFPGAVPRTFVGSLIIAVLAKGLNFITSIFGYNLLEQSSEINLQLIVRAILGLINAYSLIHLRNTANKIVFSDKKSKIKGTLGFWFSLLLLSQFHILYYASRTIPNFIALPIVNFAVSKLLRGDVSGLTWLAFTAVVFRIEVGLFAVIIALVSSLIFGQSNIIVNIAMLASGTIIGSFLSLAVDSYFWQQIILPELSSFKFNVLLNKSVEWGVEPWSAYFSKYIWNLFRPPVILLLLLPGLINDPADDGKPIIKSDDDNDKDKKGDIKIITHPARNSLRILFISSILYIVVLSFQAHKEWRFITYVIPIFTLQAANGISSIATKWSISFSSKFLVIIAIANIGVALILSLLMGFFSSFNYPGADALLFTNNYIQSNYQDKDVLVHLDVPACMTGITRFGELNSNHVKYDKTETEAELNQIWNQFDLIIVEDLNSVSQVSFASGAWELIHTSQLFSTVTLGPLVELAVVEKDNLIKLPLKFLTGEYSIIDLLQSMVVKKDFLYVYKKISHESTIEDHDTAIDQIEEVDGDAVIEDVNEQFDSIIEEIVSHSHDN